MNTLTDVAHSNFKMAGWALYDGEPIKELERAAKEAERAGIGLEIVPPSEITLAFDGGKSGRILRRGVPVPLPDFAIPAFVNDLASFNVALLRQLEIQGVVCVNRADTLVKTSDKLLTFQLLAPHGIPVPKSILLHKATSPSLVVEELGLPLVVKVLRGSKGNGVVLVKSENELSNLLQLWNAGDAREELLAQQFIAESKGRDVRVLVIDHKPVVAMKRISGDTEGFKSNFSAGGRVEAFPLTDQVRALSERVIQALDLCIGGIDLLFSDTHGHVVCEVNSVPGFQGIEASNDINVPVAMFQCLARKVMAARV